MKHESRYLFILGVVSWVLFYYFRTPFAGDWDSYDFIWQIVTHRHSNLGFGRVYFVAYNIPIWEVAQRLFQMPYTEAYKVIQLTTLCLSSGTLILYYFLLKRLLNTQAAWLGTIVLMTSPYFVIYSGFIMTEIPMFFFLMLGLCFHLKGIEEGRLRFIVLGSAVIGIMTGVRENSLVFIPLFFALPFIHTRNRSGHGWKVMAGTVLPALMVALAGPLWIAWNHPGEYPAYVAYWLSKVPRTRTFDWTLLGYLAMYMFMNSPVGTVMLPPAVIELVRRWRDRGWSARRRPDSLESAPEAGPIYNASYPELLAIAFFFVALPYMALLMDADMKHYARYVLVGVPGMAMLAGIYINNIGDRLQAGTWWKYALATGLGTAILLISSAPIQKLNQIEQRKKDIITHMYKNAPDDAVFLPGRLTPLVEGYRQMGLKPAWEMIASGWPWPGRENLVNRVSEFIESERPLYFISDGAAWQYLEQEQADINCLRDQFYFQRVDDYLQRLYFKKDAEPGEEP
ncbi:MAG: glycosyltransferase family 39 protein [Acidobacteria bacterium]|nr:glycosyltransferase family 39 protein [Acidobacteriota bacterium]MBI3658830.1 glycosyltransferase family 39 protein [Acidobacteriota bacterium]